MPLWNRVDYLDAFWIQKALLEIAGLFLCW